MNTLLLHTAGRWLRQPLPDPAGYAFVRASGAPSVTVGQGEPAPLPPDAIGLILLCRGEPYFLAVAGAPPSYLNAEGLPRQAIRLHDHDRLTCHVDGAALRLWFVRGGQGSRCYDGMPAKAICGYCGSQMTAGDEMVTCWACSETIHVDCLEHGGQPDGKRCPRCGLTITLGDDAWLPAGFPVAEEEADGRS